MMHNPTPAPLAKLNRSLEAVKPSSTPAKTCIKLRHGYRINIGKRNDFVKRLIVSAALVTKLIRQDNSAFHYLIKQSTLTRERISIDQAGFLVMLYIIQPDGNRELRKLASFYGKCVEGCLASEAKTAAQLFAKISETGLKELAASVAKPNRENDGGDGYTKPATRNYTMVIPSDLHDAVIEHDGHDAVIHCKIEVGQGGRRRFHLSSIRRFEEVVECSDRSSIPLPETIGVPQTAPERVSDRPTPGSKARSTPGRPRPPAPVERALPQSRARAIDADVSNDGFG
jgi:hypothetical protein